MAVALTVGTLCPCNNYLDVQDKLACQYIMQEGYLGIQMTDNPKVIVSFQVE